jgi:dihydroflavonol-4-reductase
VALFLAGQIKALPAGGLNFADVRDVSAGVIAAMRLGAPGERYLMGGVNWTFRELIGKVAAMSGVRAPRMQPSLGVSLASALVLRRLLPLAGRRFDLDDASIKMSALFWYCNSDKARKELGFNSRDPQRTLLDTIRDIHRRAT